MRTWVLVLLVACKGGDKPAPASGSGSATPIAIDAAPPAPAGKLEFMPDSDEEGGLKLAFGARVPKLPALGADGATIADWYSAADGPMFPMPFGVMFTKLAGGEPVVIDIADFPMVTAAAEAGNDWRDKPPSPADQTTLKARAADVMARLTAGKFVSLHEIAIPENSSGERAPAPFGNLQLIPSEEDNETGYPTLVVTLSDAKEVPLRRLRVLPYNHGTFESGMDEKPACTYRPQLASAYTDAAKQHIFLEVTYRFHELCETSVPSFFVWTLAEPVPPALAAETAAYEQAYASDAVSIETFLGKPRSHDGISIHDSPVTLSRDGQSAWRGLEREKRWRNSDLVAKTPAGWRIVATAWGQSVENAEANALAKSKQYDSPVPYTEEPGDESLRTAFASLASSGVDATAAASSELVAIGSAAGERTVGGAIFARGWNAGWKGKTTVVSSVARLAPSGTTGWVAARVLLQKTGYQIPFTVFAIFDKTAAGAWTLVHVQFSIST